METSGRLFDSLFGPNISTTGVVVPNRRAWALAEAARRSNEKGYRYTVSAGQYNPVTGRPLASGDTRITITTPDGSRNFGDLHRQADEIEMEMETKDELPGADRVFDPAD